MGKHSKKSFLFCLSLGNVTIGWSNVVEGNQKTRTKTIRLLSSSIRSSNTQETQKDPQTGQVQFETLPSRMLLSGVGKAMPKIQ